MGRLSFLCPRWLGVAVVVVVLLQAMVLLRFVRAPGGWRESPLQDPATKKLQERCDEQMMELDAQPWSIERCRTSIMRREMCDLRCAEQERDVVVFWRGKASAHDVQAMRLLRYCLRSGACHFLFRESMAEQRGCGA
jgi:hypothetical protein